MDRKLSKDFSETSKQMQLCESSLTRENFSTFTKQNLWSLVEQAPTKVVGSFSSF